MTEILIYLALTALRDNHIQRRGRAPTVTMLFVSLSAAQYTVPVVQAL